MNTTAIEHNETLQDLKKEIGFKPKNKDYKRVEL
jgi:hypothetical protein